MSSIKKNLVICLIIAASVPVCCTNNSTGLQHKKAIASLVSLSPSITREIIDLSQSRTIIGVTSFDDYRAGGVEVVGTLIQPNIEKIVTLRPDIVVSSEEDGLVQNVDRVVRAGIPVLRLKRNRNFNDICDTFIQLGILLNREDQARQKARSYALQLMRIKEETLKALADSGKQDSQNALPHVAMFVSHRPLMAVSRDSYIGGIIADAGGVCAYGNLGRPFPLVSFESLVDLDPDVIISMAGGKDDFFERLNAFKQMKCVAKGRIYSISPDIISFYTPADYIKSVITVSRILNNKRKQP